VPPDLKKQGSARKKVRNCWKLRVIYAATSPRSFAAPGGSAGKSGPPRSGRWRWWGPLTQSPPNIRTGGFAGQGEVMAKMMSKSELVGKIAADGGGKLSNKDVKGVLESLAKVGYKELKKSGVFLVPGFAKFVVVRKAATKARKGVNPFTGEPAVFKAKPARKIVRARPVKAAKDAVA
jgi:DNA-binding protein HU-beta